MKNIDDEILKLQNHIRIGQNLSHDKKIDFLKQLYKCIEN